MISYLKLINNPQDSIALLRVINTPTRGIGKSTIETLERLSLETGMSLWSAISEAIDAQAASATGLCGAEELQRPDRRRTGHAVWGHLGSG